MPGEIIRFGTASHYVQPVRDRARRSTAVYLDTKSLTSTELEKLEAACNKLPDGPDYRCKDFIGNLLLTAIDFQTRVEVVNPAMEHFRENHRFTTMRGLERTLSNFRNNKDGNLKLANSLWGTNAWTRAMFLRVIVAKFKEFGVNDQPALREWVKNADFENDVKGQFRVSYPSNRGGTGYHSIAYALFHWLCLRCGSNTIKPDVHVRRFVENAIGRKPSPEEAVDALVEIAAKTGRKTYRLDSAIWHRQRERQQRDRARGRDARRTA